MRNRALLALLTVAATIFVFGVVGLVISDGQGGGAAQRPTPGSDPSSAGDPPLTLRFEVEGSPGEVAAAYLRAWSEGDFAAMRELVDEPPADFVSRHRDFEDTLLSESVRLTPGEPVSTGADTAEVPFTQDRVEPGYGTWTVQSTLRLAVRDFAWRVIWTPAVLHPDLVEGGQVVRTVEEARPRGPLTREGLPFPRDSAAEKYLAHLSESVAGAVPTGGTEAAWAIKLMNPGEPARTLLEYRPKPAPENKIRTTIEWAVQAAAARALDGVDHPAALVAVRPGTGEILAVADRLDDSLGLGAFEGKYAPGSTFKVITAAALLNAGLTPDTMVECPSSYQIPNHRVIPNFRNEDHGTVTLRLAFALSCNTTFARQAIERLSADTLVEQARQFGFGVPIDTGIGGTCGSMNRPDNPDALAEDALGQGTVEATPLCMALVAAAVQSGKWLPPRLIDGQPTLGETVVLPQGVAEGLRSLMTAVPSHGTAAGTTLPEGVGGKTGTAEDWQGGADHAWFIGYRDDLAFSVFVEHAGTGRGAAVPIAARFLRAL